MKRRDRPHYQPTKDNPFPPMVTHRYNVDNWHAALVVTLARIGQRLTNRTNQNGQEDK